MSTVLLMPGETGIDALSHPDYQAVKDAGHSFVSVYVQPDRTDRALIERIWGAGLVVILNKEGSETAWSGGFAKGRQYAIEAIRDATDLGWEGESGIIFSLADSTVTDYAVADEAFKGVIQTMGNIESGGYGEQNYLRHLSTQSWVPPNFKFWQWKNNGPTESWADMRQTSGGTIGGIDVDYNIVKKPILAWSGYGNERKPNRMFRHNSAGSVYEIANGYKTHCSEGYFFQVLRGTIAPDDTSGLVVSYPVLSDDALTAIPDAPSPNGAAPRDFIMQLTGTAHAQS